MLTDNGIDEQGTHEELIAIEWHLCEFIQYAIKHVGEIVLSWNRHFSMEKNQFFFP